MKLGTDQRRIVAGMAIGLLVAVVIVFLYHHLALLRIFELKTLDFRFYYRGARPPKSKIVIVAIDEESVRRLGRWPWSRTLHARLIDTVSRGKPEAIFLDLFFTEPDLEHPKDDLLLSGAIKEAGNVYLDYFFLKEDLVEEVNRESLKVIRENFSLSIQGKEVESIIRQKEVTTPILSMVEGLKGAGYANIYEDEDDIYRHIPLLLRYRDALFPSIVLIMAKDHLGIKGKEIEIDPDYSLNLGTRNVPIDEQGEMLINFTGPAGNFRYISYYKVLEGKVPAAFFKDKIVLVGTTAPGIYDMRATSIGIMPGIELLANALENIIEGNFLRRTGQAGTIWIILSLGLVTGFLSSIFRRLIWCILSSLGIILAYFLLAVYLFEANHLWLEMVRPGLAIVFGHVAVMGYRYMTEERQKRQIKKIFKSYVSRQVADEILRDPSRLSLGGERKNLTVLFSDIRGFTSISETTEPEEIVEMLNEYFNVMVEAVFMWEGTIDKFIGDAIMVIFGAPVYYSDHARRAVYAALEMRKELRKLQEKWKREGRRIIDIGIGINTGEMIVGNLGSSQIMNYTVIGDNVNLASRLEGLTRRFDVPIIISQSTYERVKEIFEIKPLGKAQIRGKREEVMVYQVIE